MTSRPFGRVFLHDNRPASHRIGEKQLDKGTRHERFSPELHGWELPSFDPPSDCHVRIPERSRGRMNSHQGMLFVR
jgi:hypothetical protein